MELLNPELLSRFGNGGSKLAEQANRFANLHKMPEARFEIFKKSCVGDLSGVDLDCVKSFNMLYEICPTYAHFALMLYAGSIKYAEDAKYKISFLRVDLFHPEEVCRLFQDINTFNGCANVLNDFYQKFQPDIVDSVVIMHIANTYNLTSEIVSILKMLRWDPWFVWLYTAKHLECVNAGVCLWNPGHYATMRDLITGASLLSALAEKDF
jgi:hypothetical protein